MTQAVVNPIAIGLVIILLLGGFFSSLPIVAFSQSSSDDSSSDSSEHDSKNNNDNKFVILIFDRAYKSLITTAKPILDDYGYKATIFAICNWIGDKKSTMSWEEIESLHNEGYDVQSHGMNHIDLRTLSPDQREYEIGQSKNCLLDHGIDSTVFSAAYNKGGNDSEIIETIAKYYDFGFSGHSTLMFLHCDGWEKFGFDEANYKGQTDCRTYHDVDINGDDNFTPTPTNRYSIKEWSHDREHSRINEKYSDSSPHSPMITEILFDKFVEIVNNQTKFNLNGKINAIPLITYHEISNESNTSTSEELFTREMKYLHDNDFQVITVSDLGYNEDDNYFVIKK
jgi:peptidoglycan/xylan/chitin deacetylase (PgdA/CDA1 family)